MAITSEEARKVIKEIIDINTGRCQKVADALTLLLAERDAAIADLKKLSYCSNCKLCTEIDGVDCWCSAISDWYELDDSCEDWEWRGVQNE